MESNETALKNDTNVTVLYPLYQDNLPIYCTLVILSIVTGVINIIGNSLTIIAVVRYERLQTVTNVFVVGLALSDMAIGIINIPSFMIPNLISDPDTWVNMCLYMSIIAVIPLATTILNLVVISVERCILITKPYCHARWLTVRRAIVIEILVWVYITIVTSMTLTQGQTLYPGQPCYAPFYTPTQKYVSSVLINIVSMLFVMSLCHMIIFFVARRKVRAIRDLTASVASETANNNMHAMNARTNKAVGIVIGVFAIYTVPISIISVVTGILHYGTIPPKWSVWANHFAVIVSCASCSSNPIIYAWKYPGFKTCFKRILNKCCFTFIDEEKSTISTVAGSHGGTSN